MQHNHTMKSAEWYTPVEWLARVWRTLGGIELDPCSSLDAVSYAGNYAPMLYYTKDDDGLSKRWDCRTIFVNPPGGRVDGTSLPKAFLERCEQTFRYAWAGRKEIIYLAYAIEHLRWATPTAVAIPRKRIKFVGAGSSPVNGNAFLLYTHNRETVERFCNEFSGSCLVLHGD